MEKRKENHADMVMLVTFLEENWSAFVAHCGNEQVAEETFAEIKHQARMR